MEEDDEFPPQILKLKKETIRLRDRVKELEEENRNLQHLQRNPGLTLHYKDLLRQCRVSLIQDLFPIHSIDVLIQEKEITEEQAAEINAAPTRQEKNRRLVDLLMTRGSDAFTVFLESLKEGNKHLWSTLTGKIDELLQDEESTSRRILHFEKRIRELEEACTVLWKENSDIEEKYRVLVDENRNLHKEVQTLKDPRERLLSDAQLPYAYRDVVAQCYKVLVDNLEPTDSINHLITAQSITLGQAGDIRAGANRKEQNRRLLGLLMTRGYGCFEVFLESLKESNGSLFTILNEKISDLCRQGKESVSFVTQTSVESSITTPKSTIEDDLFKGIKETVPFGAQASAEFPCGQSGTSIPKSLLGDSVCQGIKETVTFQTQTSATPKVSLDEASVLDEPDGPSLDAQRYYHKFVDREGAENLLKKQKDGTFLVRRQKDSPNYMVSIRCAAKVIHVRITRLKDGKYDVEGYLFESVPAAIDHLMKKNLRSRGEDVKLLKPLVQTVPKSD